MAEVRNATPQETFNALAQFSDTKAANQAELNGRHIRLYKDTDGEFKIAGVTKWELVVDAIKVMLNSIGFRFTTFDRIDLHNNILQHLNAGTGITVESAAGVTNENLAKAVMALDALREAKGKEIVNDNGIKLFTQLAADVRNVAIHRFESEDALDEQIAQIERARTPDIADSYEVINMQPEADQMRRGSPVGEPRVVVDAGNIWDELRQQAQEIEANGRSTTLEDPLLRPATTGFLDMVLGSGRREDVDNLDRFLYIIRSPEAAQGLLTQLERKQAAVERIVAADTDIIDYNKEIKDAEAESLAFVEEMCNKRLEIQELETAFEGKNPNWFKKQANIAKQKFNKRKIEALKAEVKVLEEVTIPEKEKTIKRLKGKRSDYAKRKQKEVLQNHTRLTPDKFAAVLKNTRFIVSLHTQNHGHRTDMVQKVLKVRHKGAETYERYILRQLVQARPIADHTTESLKQELTEAIQA